MQLGRFRHEVCFRLLSKSTLWPPHWRCWISFAVWAPLGQGNSVSSLLFTLSNGRHNPQLWTCCFLATVIGTWINKQHSQRPPQKCRAVFSPFLALLGFLLNFVAVLHQRKIMHFYRGSVQKIANTGVDSTIRRRMARIQDAMRFDIEVC